MSAPRVAAVGLATPLGLTAPSTLAAIRAGMTPYRDHPSVVGPGGPARTASLSTLRDDAPREERLLHLLGRAVSEALSVLPPTGTTSIPCFVASPTKIRGLQFEDRTVAWHSIDNGERAGVFECLQNARRALAQSAFVLVAGVDSLVDEASVQMLASKNALLSRSNIDGVLPGEAAAALLLGTTRTVPAARALADITAEATARESQPFASHAAFGSPSPGLSAVFRALSDAHHGRVDTVISGVPSQQYFGREFSHAYLHNASLMPEPLVHTGPLDALGDVGHAAGAVALVAAACGSVVSGRPSGPRPSDSTLVYASANDGHVGGAIVTSPPGR